MKNWWNVSYKRKKLLCCSQGKYPQNLQNTCSTVDKNTLKKKKTLHKYNAENTYIFYCFIDSPKSRLLIIMVNTSVSMKNKYTFFFSLLTIASIDAVVRPVIPLAREDIKTFYAEKWEFWIKYQKCFRKYINYFFSRLLHRLLYSCFET